MNVLRIKTARGMLDLRRLAQTLRFFAGLPRKHVGALSIAALAIVAATLMALAAPWPIQVVLDQVILDEPARPWIRPVIERLGSAESVLVAACIAVVMIAVLEGVFQYFGELLQASTAHKIANSLRRRLFRHLQTLSLRFHDRQRTGDLLLRLTGDITMVRELLVEAMFDLAAAVLTFTALTIVMFRLAPTLTLVALATLPVVVLASAILSVKLRAAVRRSREKEGDLISIAGEALSAMALIKAFTREEQEKERFSRLGRSSLRAGLKSARLQSKLARIVHIVTSLGICGILYLGAHEIWNGRMTPGTLIVFMAYYRGLLKPIRKGSRIAARMAKASSCADRVREVLQTQPEIRDRENAVDAPPLAGRITFEAVSFGYDARQPVLSDIELDIQPGQRVALVGPTGAGKSTLVKLILRFYDPAEGVVRVDGRDVREFTLQSLRRQISVVQQQTILFGTTIAENIAIGRADASRDEIRAAAAELGIDQWIDALPAGFDTPVDQRGVSLSGGQRQLIALARAVLRGGTILIFDEPTTGLDAVTEAQIQFALRRVMRGRTTVIISHGARPISDVDRAVVLGSGHIVQVGSPQELFVSEGPFRELFSHASSAEADAWGRLAAVGGTGS